MQVSVKINGCAYICPFPPRSPSLLSANAGRYIKIIGCEGFGECGPTLLKKQSRSAGDRDGPVQNKIHIPYIYMFICPARSRDLFSEGLRWALLAKTRQMGLGGKGRGGGAGRWGRGGGGGGYGGYGVLFFLTGCLTEVSNDA